MPLHVKFGACLEYNNGNGFHFARTNFAGLGERAVCELRIRCSPTNPPLQPAYMPPMPRSFFVDGLSDPTRLPSLWEDAQSADLAGSDFHGRFFFVLLAVPVQGAWDSPRHDRAGLFRHHYRH